MSGISLVMACGVPVIGTDATGLPDIAVSEDCGAIMVDPGDALELADAIGKGLTRDWDRKSIARYAVSFAWA